MNKLNCQAHMYLVNFLSMFQKSRITALMMDFTLFIKSTTSHILCYFPAHVSNHCCYSTRTKNNLHSN